MHNSSNVPLFESCRFHSLLQIQYFEIVHLFFTVWNSFWSRFLSICAYFSSVRSPMLVLLGEAPCGCRISNAREGQNRECLVIHSELYRLENGTCCRPDAHRCLLP